MTQQKQLKNPSVVEVEAAERKQRVRAAIAAAEKYYLRPDEAAQFLGVSRRTLSNLQKTHAISYAKLNRVVVFKRQDLIAAVERFRFKAIGE